MKPRRLHSETITSSFMDSPRPRLSLALPRSCGSPSGASSGGRLEPSHLAEELGRARRLADESRDLGLQEGADLALAPADGRDERLVPARRAEPLERRERRGRGGDRPPVLARARLADGAAPAEGGPGGRGGPTEIGRAHV